MTPVSTLALYVLDKHEPVLCESFVTFDLFLTNFNARRVAHDTVGDVRVSSVFNGITTHNPPRLFETMVFGGAHDRHCVHAETWDECLENHAQALRMIDAPILPRPDDECTAHEKQLARCIGVFASVIKSGDPWTALCQPGYDEALAATPPASKEAP